MNIRPTGRVAVIGDGKLGLLCAQVVALSGCNLIAIGHHADKLNLLKRRGIATTTDLATIRPASLDIVIEATGTPDGYAAARELVRPRGTIVLKSTYRGEIQVDLARVVVDEVTLIGSRCGPFPPAIRLLANHQIDVEPLIQARYSLDDGVAAFERATQKGMLKVIVEM